MGRKKKAQTLKRRYKANVMKQIFSFLNGNIDTSSFNICELHTGDKLFNTSENPNDPRLMPAAIDNELYYEYGYLGTSIFLLSIIEFGKSYLHKDSYIYPAMFCFRQYIENMIKIIVQKYSPEKNLRGNHNLITYWNELIKHIENDDYSKRVEDIINELQTFDSKATAFRYPGALNAIYNKDPKRVSMLIDVKKLKERVLQVYRYFDGLYEQACRI